MKCVFRNSKFAIFDDVLPQETFEKVWIHVQNENYATALNNGNWLKVWRIGDSMPMAGPEYYLTRKPFNNYMDAISHIFAEIAKTCTDICGEDGVWKELVTRSYIYPRGTKLSWHDDNTKYTGAFTYYVHPYWGSTWGGELMVAEVPPDKSHLKKKPMVGPHLDHEWEDEFILDRGVGQWIAPKPNRCVVMTAGTYHAINRVDVDAGDHARASIVGFLIRSDKAVVTDKDKPVVKQQPQPQQDVEKVDLGIKGFDLGDLS